MYTTDVLFYGFKSEKFVRVKKTRHEYKRKIKSSFIIFGVSENLKGFVFEVHSKTLGSGTPILGSGKALCTVASPGIFGWWGKGGHRKNL